MAKGVKIAVLCAFCLAAALAVVYGIKTWVAG